MNKNLKSAILIYIITTVILIGGYEWLGTCALMAITTLLSIIPYCFGLMFLVFYAYDKEIKKNITHSKINANARHH